MVLFGEFKAPYVFLRCQDIELYVILIMSCSDILFVFLRALGFLLKILVFVKGLIL